MSVIKEIYELTKDNNVNNELYDEILEKLNDFEIKDKRLKSVLIFLIYNYDDYSLKMKNNILYIDKENIVYNYEQDVKISLLKARLDHIENKFILEAKIKVKIIVAFNYTKEDVEKKYLIPSNKKNNGNDEDTVKLNVIPTEPKYNIDQIVLNDSTLEELEKVITMVKSINKIYYEWGYEDIDPVPRCIVNFFGPPGTGKTMSAHILASELNLKILSLNYSDIESKFVGDAPKNLVQAFEIAKRENCLLFFDEADSFLGKRITNVSSSSDQAVNSLRSQMLILLESFNGIVVFATNLHENYDSAFESRILKHVQFELPDKNMRLKIIKKMIPSKAPISEDVKDDDFLLSLSEKIEGFAPREIKNTILEVLITSIQKNVDINRELFEEVFKKSKEKFDAIKSKANRKIELKKQIKENLENKNYVVKNKDSESEDEENDSDDESINKKIGEENGTK